MKLRSLLPTLGLAIALCNFVPAEETTQPVADSPEAGLKAIDARLEAKIKAGFEAPVDFAAEAAAYDE